MAVKLKLEHRDITLRAMRAGEEEEHDADGLWWHRQGEIAVSPQVAPAEQARLAIHELLHALWSNRGLPDKADEEDAVERLSSGLATVFRDNPEFLGVLHQALSNGVAIV